MTDLETGIIIITAVLLGAHYVQSRKFDRAYVKLRDERDSALAREGRLLDAELKRKQQEAPPLQGALPFRPFRAAPLTKAEVETVLAGAESNAGLAAVMQVLEEWIAKLNMEGHAGNELSRGGYVGVMRVYEELRGRMTKPA